MKQWFIALITSLCLLTEIASAQAAVKPKALDPNVVVKENINQFMRKYRVPGVAVALYVHNRSYVYYFGYANKETKKIISGETLFEVGPLTQLFTTLLFAQQANAKKMSLDAPFIHYVPSAKLNVSSAADVTLLNLATYTTGIRLELPHNITTLAQLDDYLAQWQASNRAGKTWIYSNTAIGLLGYAITSATGQTYEALLQQKILQVLNMRHTYLTTPAHAPVAQGYNEYGRPVPLSENGLLPAASALKTTLPDMRRFLSAAIHLSGTPYSVSQALRIAQTPYFLLANNSEQGLGWQIVKIDKKNNKELLNVQNSINLSMQAAKPVSPRQYSSDALMDKTGATSGFRAYIAVIPSKGSGIVILTNRYSANSNLMKTGREILFKLSL